jgi:hypothetical protein
MIDCQDGEDGEQLLAMEQLHDMVERFPMRWYADQRWRAERLKTAHSVRAVEQ